jgi:hypothetical protein
MCLNASLPDPYVAEYDKDFICSPPNSGGMTHCSEIPPTMLRDGRRCNGSVPETPDGIMFNESIDTSYSGVSPSSCINWNQYYTECRPQGSNPFHGAISFDNIGLAWIAIFQV